MWDSRASSAGYRAERVTKRYAGTVALLDATFEVVPGEVHALVGGNGAGKSTMVKILTGAVSPTEGELRLDGEILSFRSPRDARLAGIAVVHQDNQLFDELTVWENVAALSDPPRRGPLLDRTLTRQRAGRVIRALGVYIDLDQRMRGLPATERKLVEIARGLLEDPRYLLLDEPTAALDPTEAKRLAQVIQRLKADGKGVVLVSHHLEEVLELADRVTVLRDGRVAGSFRRDDVDERRLIEAMVGGAPEPRAATSGTSAGAEILTVRGMVLAPGAEPLDLTLHRGEIVAVVGLVGSGVSKLLARVAGARPDPPAEIRVDGRPLRLRSTAEATRAGIGYLPPDRNAAGIIRDQSIAVNIGLASLRRLSRWGLCTNRQLAPTAVHMKEALNIRCRDTRQPIGTLSGGNQQKALIGRWLASGASILVIDEPTQGVDVAARAEIHGHLRRFVGGGNALLFGSSDLDEVLVLANRVLVLRKGELAEELDLTTGEVSDRHELLALVTGLSGPLSAEIVT
jgi:ABC-type sugar transport system ATPase subunit